MKSVILLLAAPSACTRYIIPLTGSPSRTRSTIEAFSRSHFLTFSTHGRSVFINGEPAGEVVSMVVHTTTNPFRYRTNHHTAVVARNGSSVMGVLSIGPTGDLVRATGSIDVVMDRGLIRLGYDEAEFIQDFCFSESVLSLPTRTVRFDQQPYAATTRALLRMSTMTGQIETLVFFTGGTGGGWSTTTSVMTLPSAFMRNILEIIPMGIRLPGEELNIFFMNCESTRQLLPNILVTFLQGDQATGMLNIFPEDYTEFTEDDICVLKLRETFGLTSETDMRINLIGMEGINFRVTERQIIICDSL
jgi:hypothetical protein